MTINIANNNPRINYTATSGQTVFTVPFEFFENTDIKVYVEGTLKTITTHYSVTGGNGSTGTVTMNAGVTLNNEVTLVRDVPLERTTDLTANYNAASLDGQLDRIVAEVADLNDRVSRTIQINDYELASGLLLPALDSRKGKTIQFNTSSGALEVGPTGADLTAIGSVTSEIATLAGISGNITTVASANAAVTAVSNSMTSVNAINAALSNVNSVAGAITNINLVGGSISDVNDVADSLGEISAVQAKLTNIDTVAVASTNIGTVAGSIAQVNNVSSKIADVTGVNTNMSAITTANANSSNINLVASSIDDVNDVGTVITKVTTVADNIANVNLVGPVAQYMSDVANNITAISAVAPLAGDLSNVTNNLSAIQAAATNATNAANSATAAANSATSIGNAETTTTANAVAAANSAAAAATALDNFDDKYLGVKSSDPTVDNDGDALVQGALYFSSSSSAMQVYDGANWIAASSSGVASLTLFEYTATAGQTAFSGNDDNGLSMSFIAANLLVTMNGVILDPSDYTTTTGLTVTLDVGAAVGDVVNIYAFKSFQVADTVPATTGGTFIGPVQFNSNVTVSGTVDGVDIAAFKTSFDNLSTDIVSDTTPQLGGDLASNGNDINFADNDKAIFGAGSDLQIYHDELNSIIKDAGTGNIEILGNNLRLKNADASNSYLNGDNGGGVTLYHAGTQKFITTSTGVDVTGTVTSDELTANNGGSNTNIRLQNTNSGSGSADGFLIQHATNAHTYVWNYENADTIFGTNGTERMRIDASGKVGIGTSSPNNLLTLNSNTSNTAMTIQSSDTGGSAVVFGDQTDFSRGRIIYNNSDDSMSFETNNLSEAMRIDASGNVGINTSSPDAMLTVDTNVGGSSTGTLARFHASKGESDSTFLQIAATRHGTASVQRVQLQAFDDDGSTGRTLSLNPSGGSVGIGTNSPSYKLDVAGHIQIRAGESLRLQNVAQNSAATISCDGAGTNTDLSFKTANTERMRIDSSGRVTTPYQPLCAFKSSVGTASNQRYGVSNTILNQGSHLDTGSNNGRFTCPVAGNYKCTFVGYTNYTTGYGYIHLRKNGTSQGHPTHWNHAGSAAHTTVGNTFIVNCAAGNYLEFWLLNANSRVQDANITFELIG